MNNSQSTLQSSDDILSELRQGLLYVPCWPRVCYIDPVPPTQSDPSASAFWLLRLQAGPPYLAGWLFLSNLCAHSQSGNGIIIVIQIEIFFFFYLSLKDSTSDLRMPSIWHSRHVNDCHKSLFVSVIWLRFFKVFYFLYKIFNLKLYIKNVTLGYSSCL